MKSDVLIVGAGQGGAQTAIALRQRKYAGSITVVGAEPDFPYERPPLTKEYLAGEKPFERLLIRPHGFWHERQIRLILGVQVNAVNAATQTVQLSTGDQISYGSLIWAAGGAPRSLSCPGSGLRGVHTVRTRADIDRLASELPTVSQAAVIGGGYIGLEAAAVLRKLGKDVVLLEAMDRVLARVAGDPISRFYEAEHRTHGVDVRTNVNVESIVEKEGSAFGVRLATGELIRADIVIVGIGIVPVIEPLVRAGAKATNGVFVDEHCRTSLPSVLAVGDCALHKSIFADGRWVRLESVQNANDQAQTVARMLTGDPQPYESVPWFWSDQYDVKLQSVGLSTGYDALVLRGDPGDRSFSVVYLRGGKVAALDCVTNVKDYAQGKALVQAGIRIPPHRLADKSVTLRQLLQETQDLIHRRYPIGRS